MAEIETTTNTVTAQRLVAVPFDAVLHGDRLYVTQISASALQVIDTTTGTAVETFNLNFPLGLAADGDHVYVVTADGLAVITSADPSTGSLSMV